MKVRLVYTPSAIQEPLIAEIILATRAKININRADIGAVSGEMIIDIPEDKYNQVVRMFRDKGLKVSLLHRPIVRDDNRCVMCGICTSICPIGAFKIEKDWSVTFEPEKCIQCGVCVSACPTSALELSEGEI
ncbi:MAG TPA: 4Fe-4S dicluster domain-containing protein [Candidatus Syntrophoarchaeum butanivorans]|uniref:4Fe-4S dicluster domain-containing protein n=1 Tax=Candidatus Syntropharchaeum butanivorans TaxID=1839936 RepID=A0A7J2S3A4_9EURY|nr:MAG: 4Fe-4S dicluster domain-containing protein [Candidatus Syntrophoarchaeum sp. WYZ-LMO15]HEC57752.1 4Fe-4S dicluster domain-containing protein [Candidatus Syntrophoarchaeum butanivorans]